MNEALAYVVAQRMERTAAALRKNNMEAYCVKTADEVVPLVKTLLAEGATVGAGGSMTLEECGVMDLLRSGAYHFLDRGAPGLTPEDIGKIYRQIFSADCYFASANAVTEAGEILNVDGNANRVAAITFGPGKCQTSFLQNALRRYRPVRKLPKPRPHLLHIRAAPLPARAGPHQGHPRGPGAGLLNPNLSGKKSACFSARALSCFQSVTCPAVCATPKPTEMAGGCPAGVSRSLPPLAAKAGREVCDPLT